MTTIEIKTSGKRLFRLKAGGHCQNHDVCVAVSALVNTICQYAEDFSDEHEGVKTDIKSYGSGDVELEVKFGRAIVFSNFMHGCRAVSEGLKMYGYNYPEDVVCVDAQ